MTKEMFIDISHVVAKRNSYFQRTFNAAGLPGFTTIQKVTVAIRILGYGGPAHHLDVYIRMGESTTLEIINKFTQPLLQNTGTYTLENLMHRTLLGSST
jgi:hypothetical protein